MQELPLAPEHVLPAGLTVPPGLRFKLIGIDTAAVASASVGVTASALTEVSILGQVAVELLDRERNPIDSWSSLAASPVPGSTMSAGTLPGASGSGGTSGGNGSSGTAGKTGGARTTGSASSNSASILGNVL